MSGKRGFEDQLAALESLRHQPAEATLAPLRKALAHRNNYIVGKAADIARELRRTELIPELLAAYDRFFTDPIKTDPQCWAKNALSRALSELECGDPEVFLRGLRHIQLEPIWGGQSDTAGTLRSTCAHALVACRGLPERELLTYLIELFRDREKTVRVEAARAMESVGSQSAALLLRLRATLASDDPEVLAACFSGVLAIEGVSAIPWAEGYLAAGDEVAAEASLAIAGTHSLEGFAVLQARFQGVRDPWFCPVLLSAMALTRQQAAYDFLFELIRSASGHAEAALQALLRSAPRAEIIEELERLVSGNPRLARLLAEPRR